MEDDILYHLSASFYDGFKIRIREFTVVNETAKNYMCLPKVPEYKWKKDEKSAFLKEHEGKVQFDEYGGRMHRATLLLTEITEEDVYTHGVNELKEQVRAWCQKKADYYIKKLKETETPTIEQ